MARHMAKQMQKLEGRLRTIDMVIEVHDARVALTGRNENFTKKLTSIRPHILVMNKKDLIDQKHREPIEQYYHNQGEPNIVWTDCKQRLKEPLDRLRDMMLDVLKGEMRFNRAVKTEYQVMVVGIPNVGKSSLINSLRICFQQARKATKEGADPGVTLEVQNRIRILRGLQDSPLLYVLDTPGVLDPYYRSPVGQLKLSLCNLLIRESATSYIETAGYLLHFMNKNQDYSYAKLLDLPEAGPYYDTKKLLLHICQARGLKGMVRVGKDLQEKWLLDQGATAFLNLYRKNQIGADCFLDDDVLFR